MRQAIFYFLAVNALFIIYGCTDRENKGAPQITVEADYWDFGEIKQGQTAEKSFWVKNEGGADLAIETIFTSCDCTTAKISSVKIEPRQKAKLDIVHNSQEETAGEVTADIYIFSNDPVHPRKDISIRATIVSE